MAVRQWFGDIALAILLALPLAAFARPQPVIHTSNSASTSLVPADSGRVALFGR